MGRYMKLFERVILVPELGALSCLETQSNMDWMKMTQQILSSLRIKILLCETHLIPAITQTHDYPHNFLF